MEREVEVYQDAAGEWRWRVWGENGSDVVADSGEGYANRVDALAMAASLFPGLAVKDVEQGD